jgi:hypothetical protein
MPVDKPLDIIAQDWQRDDSDLFEWVRNFSDSFYNLKLNGKESLVADFLKVTIGELASVLRLAALTDEELSLVATKRPARVFWFLLAEATSPEILKEILEGFDSARGIEPSFDQVNQALKRHQPMTELDYILRLDDKDFWFLASKAKHAGDGVTAPQERSLLASCAKRISSGQEISIPQANWAVNIVNKLVDARVLADHKLADDREQVLDLLQRLAKA